MTLQASGPISIGDIATEFGLAANSVFPTAFYGKGGAPSSGPLSLGDFYGRSNIAFTPDGGPVFESQYNNASVTISCSQSATWTYTGGGTGTSVSRGSGTSGTTIQFFASAFGPIGNKQTATGTWSLTGTSGGVTRNFDVTVEATGDQL